MSKREPLLRQIERLAPDEREIVRALVNRLSHGRKSYGPWRVDDGRDNHHEALLEVLDAMHYCAAELVRLSRRNESISDEELGGAK